MRDYPQHEDLGLNPEADQTEDLRLRRTSGPSEFRNSRAVLENPGVGAPSEDRCFQPADEYRLESTIMTQTAYPLLPPGADADFPGNDDWQPAEDGHPTYRCVWSPPVGGSVYIRTVAVQYDDGSVANTGGDAPLVYIENTDYTPAAARAVAKALLQAADLADAWAGKHPVSDGGPAIAIWEDSGDELHVTCHPFEADDDAYAGEKYLAIHYNREEEAFVILDAHQAGRLAQLLIGDDQ